jgi:hypothetical protein
MPPTTRPAMKVPELGDVSKFDMFVKQFDRYLDYSEIVDDTKKLQIFLLALGNDIAALYDEVDWGAISNGETEYGRACKFVRSKLLPQSCVLSERILFYGIKQDGELLTEFVSRVRNSVRKCQFPDNFVKEVMRDMFVCGLTDEAVRKAVCRAYTNSAEGTDFTFDDAIQVAEREIASHTLADNRHAQIGNAILHQNPNVVEAPHTYVQQSPQSQYQNQQQFQTPYGQISVAHQTPAVSQNQQPHYNNNNFRNVHSFQTQARTRNNCGYCGRLNHPRQQCSAQNVLCHNCGKLGHYKKMCRAGSTRVGVLQVAKSFQLTAMAKSKRAYLQSADPHGIRWLIDTGADVNIITAKLARQLGWKWKPDDKIKINGVSSSPLIILGTTTRTIKWQNGNYNELSIVIVSSLCEEAIVGTPFFSQHEKVTVHYDGPKPPLDLYVSVAKFKADSSEVIKLQPNVIPVRSPTRYKSAEDKQLIADQIAKWLQDDVIAPSHSPWRSQIVLVKKHDGSKRVCIDYKSTINKWTIADAFPIPLMKDLLLEVGKYSWYSSIDMKAAYLQMALPPSDHEKTAFEANGQLYEFRRLPFGVKNGPAAFARTLGALLSDIPGVHIYFDDIVVGGRTEEEHDNNLRTFMTRCSEKNITINEKKSTFKKQTLTFLGHIFKQGEYSPDPDRLKPFMDFPIPKTSKQLRRFLGMATYYAKWVQGFATICQPLYHAVTFPLQQSAVDAIESLKKKIAEGSLSMVEPGVPLMLRTDASKDAVAGALSQRGRPIAYVSRTLSQQERRWSAVEIEGFAIHFAMEKLRHYLLGQRFSLVTDNLGCKYLFDDGKPKSEIKNAKIQRWRLATSDLDFSVTYKPGKTNGVADALSRVTVVRADDAADFVPLSVLVESIHRQLGHPGVKRTISFLKEKHPGRMKGATPIVTNVIAKCEICARLKPRHPKPVMGQLITSTRPFERMSIDFIGPMPRTQRGFQYALTAVDEFTRFPFAIPTRDMSTSTVIECLTAIFTLWGPPQSIHSDRGANFESQEFKTFLNKWGVHKTRTCAYRPSGNGQCERTNGTIKRTIALRLAENKRGPTRWDEEMSLALANMRQLYCTSTKTTPHQLMMGWTRNSALAPQTKPTAEPQPTTTTGLPAWVQVGAQVYVKQPVGRIKTAIIERILTPWVVRLRYVLPGDRANGRRDTCSTRYLTRKPEEPEIEEESAEDMMDMEDELDETLPWVQTPRLKRARKSTNRLIDEI